MTDTLSNITAEWMERRRVDIIERQKALNIRASGKSAESLETVAKGESVSLLGDPSFLYQEYGRGPTGKKGPVPLYVIIRQWMKDKGLREEGGFNAYAIANKIHKQGTRLHRALKGDNNGVQPLGIFGIIDNNLPELENALGLEVRDTLESAILQQFKRIK